jgi:hypothetical protein
MNITLKRREFLSQGIFGDYFDETGKHVCVTLEHAYLQPGGSYAPKLPKGVYLCVRGIHTLHDGVPFETFEITNVPGHSGMLIHKGNYNNDSDGCTLVGQSEVDSNGVEMITNSRVTFANFMKLQTGISQFLLEVL